MKIEDILKYLANEKYIPDENKIKYKILCRDDVNSLLNYIVGLQRKEYNNSKAIEYINKYLPNYDFDKSNLNEVLNILEKGE